MYKSGVFKTQTTSNSSGFYNIMICPYGYGNYTVTGYYKDKWNEVWTDSESFVFDEESADSLDYTYSINLYLGTSK